MSGFCAEDAMNIIIAAMNEAGSIDKWKVFGNRANPGRLYKSTVTRGPSMSATEVFFFALAIWHLDYCLPRTWCGTRVEPSIR
jgi:hypothetical protein